MRPSLLALMIVMALPGAAQNIYPDPGFESTGAEGTAHGGSRAGHLVVGALNHFAAIGGAIKVTPFARYRVSLWVKVRGHEQAFMAPYIYHWDSYEWAFQSSPRVQGAADWVRCEATFIPPDDTMMVHPVAYLDTSDSEAWVDDVDVVQIQDAHSTMSALATKPDPDENEKRLLARWYVSTKRPALAAALLPGTSGLLRADIATVLALASRNRQDRIRYASEAVAWGGPTYFEGVAKFNQMTAGLPQSDKVGALVTAIRSSPTYDRCLSGARLVVASLGVMDGNTGGVREQAAAVRSLYSGLQAAAAAVPPGTPVSEAVGSLLDEARLGVSQADRRIAELGRCVLTIGGSRVTGRTHAIATPTRPTIQETYAARQLQRHLELCTGEVVPVVPETGLKGRVPLFVGQCRAAGYPRLKIATGGLGLEGLHIRTEGRATAFAGNRRGLLYAVYAFLEDNLGCRWFTPDCWTYPRQGSIKVGKIDRVVVPRLEYRAGDYPIARPGYFAAQCRLNGAYHGQTAEQGGKVGVHSLAHTFAALLPPEKYFATHPEYFSLVNGRRQSGYAQLCLTNPAVLKIVIGGVRQWIHDLPDQTVFSVSQNDTANYCECDRCRAIADLEGSQSGPMLRFVNAVADAIGKDHPGVTIETLAYQYTRKPPRITKPRSNVIICLCSIECCFAHPLDACPTNRSFVDDIKGWSRICKRLWIWDYIINYAHSICPFPNLDVLKPNINFFLRNGVTGIYEESCYYTKGSELQELRNYIMAKTLYDPAYDTKKAIREFCAAFYGAAAPQVIQYVELIHAAVRKDPNLHVRIYTHPRDYVTSAEIAQARELFDRAEAAVANDPVRLHRVRVARLPVQYAEITVARGGAWKEQTGRLVQGDSTDLGETIARFEKTARAEGVTAISEGGAGLDAWLASIPRLPNAMEVITLGGPALKADILPALGGRIWRLRDASGRDLLHVGGGPSGYYPGEHGYEEYALPGYRSQGWSEPYQVTARSAGAVTLQATLSDGLRIERTIALAPGSREVTITSTVTNTSSQPRQAGLRVHPAFHVKSTATAAFRLGGQAKLLEMANPSNPQAEKDMWFRETDRPAGEWSILDRAAGVVITDRFDPAQVEQCMANWDGATGRVNLELFAPSKILAPGESQTIRHTYSITQTEQ